MRFRRKGRFSELVERQLDLFAADDAELLAEAADAERAWNAAVAEDAEEAYGDYQLVVDAIADRLLDIRESYARTLDEDGASEYSAAFTREATRRYRRYATLLADLEDYGRRGFSRRHARRSRGCRNFASLRWADASRLRPCRSSDRPSA